MTLGRPDSVYLRHDLRVFLRTCSEVDGDERPTAEAAAERIIKSYMETRGDVLELVTARDKARKAVDEEFWRKRRTAQDL